MIDLFCSDPEADKREIEAKKDTLLEGSCDWVFEDDAFCKWWNSQDSHLLWISGYPGKGKTMIIIATIAEIERRLKDKPNAGVLTYFFFQDTSSEHNTALSALRGLVHFIIRQKDSLLHHLRKKYDAIGKALFEGPRALYSLLAVFTDILSDPDLPVIYLVVDALDECKLQQAEFLSFLIRENDPVRSKIKIVVSSRNEPAVKGELQSSDVFYNTSLEVNEDKVCNAVKHL